MRFNFVRVFVVVAAFVELTISAEPVCAWVSKPMLNPANGHYYAFFNGREGEKFTPPRSLAFEDALSRAAAMSHFGVPGHLATITSQSEQDFVRRLFDFHNVKPGSHEKPFSSDSYWRFWIGASDAAAEGEWRWVAGPEAGELFWLGDYSGDPFGYHHFQSYEPNNRPQNFAPAGEDYLAITINNGTDYDLWNDVNDTDVWSGYVPKLGIVEFSSVPEPGAIALTALASVVLVCASRIRCR